MAETIAIDGQTFLKRDPLGVLGLSIITFGIYWFYWYYKINDELRRFERDETISPTRSLMAVLFGWIIIVPPFIALYNTAKHVQAAEQPPSNVRLQLEDARPAGAQRCPQAASSAAQSHGQFHPPGPATSRWNVRRAVEPLIAASASSS